MKFAKTIAFDNPADLEILLPSLPRGQWIALDGAKGRVVGMGFSVWVAWGPTARNAKHFARMCTAFAERGK